MQPTIQSLKVVRAAAFMAALAAAACGERSPLVPSPDLPPLPAPIATFTVSGVIVEETESGSVPLEGVTIENPATHGVAVTDAEGAYAMSGLAAGPAQLNISKDGYVAKFVEMMIAGNERIDVTLVRE
jgi:hypothetical protein